MNFEAGNETREKIRSDFIAEQNEEWSEKSGLLFILLFSREREIEMWKIFCKRAKSFVHVRLFKVVFFIFCYDFVLILGCFWQWFEDFWQFMRILCYFGGFSCILLIFRLILAFFFWRFFVLLAQMGIEKTPCTWPSFLITFGYSFVDMSHFLEKYVKNGTIFFIFFFLQFFVFFGRFLDYYDLPIGLRASGYPISSNEFFFGFICFCDIKKFMNFSAF